MGGTTCPKCGCYARLRRDGTMGEHKTEYYVRGQIRGGLLGRCPYAGVTPEDAAQGITAPKKRPPKKKAAAMAAGKPVTARKAVRYTGPDQATVDLVLERDKNSCVYCGKGVSTEPGQRGMFWSIQHRDPRGAGGTSNPDVNLPSRLVVLCGSGTTGCHGWAEENRREAEALGLLLRDGDDPYTTPVSTWYGVAFLDDKGDWSSEMPEVAA